MTRDDERRKTGEEGGLAHAVILACALAISAVSLSLQARADEPEPGLADAFSHGRFSLELRPRYNRIDEGDKPERTEGVTMRVIAGWRSAPWNGLRLTIEGIHTGHLGAKNFNDDGALFATSPYPLLPDPGTTDFNQVHLEYSGLPATRVRAGRQVVRMDSQRWVSDNDFRQIPQLFEGVSVANTSLANTELYAAHFDRVRTTSGTDNSLKLSLAHVAFNPAPGHSLAAYGVFHDQPQNGAFTGFANSSYRVLGARAEGELVAPGGIELAYVVDAASQRAYAGGDPRIDARYWRVGGGAEWHETTLRLDHEVKGSNGGAYGVQMPLTDFYGFNGWTLHFFNTPRQGLRDTWVTLRLPAGPLVLYAEVHRFRSDFGDLRFGRETDAGISWSFHDGALLRLQHARYDPGRDGLGASVRKTWLTLTYTY